MNFIIVQILINNEEYGDAVSAYKRFIELGCNAGIISYNFDRIRKTTFFPSYILEELKKISENEGILYVDCYFTEQQSKNIYKKIDMFTILTKTELYDYRSFLYNYLDEHFVKCFTYDRYIKPTASSIHYDLYYSNISVANSFKSVFLYKNIYKYDEEEMISDFFPLAYDICPKTISFDPYRLSVDNLYDLSLSSAYINALNEHYGLYEVYYEAYKTEAQAILLFTIEELFNLEVVSKYLDSFSNYLTRGTAIYNKIICFVRAPFNFNFAELEDNAEKAIYLDSLVKKYPMFQALYFFNDELSELNVMQDYVKETLIYEYEDKLIGLEFSLTDKKYNKYKDYLSQFVIKSHIITNNMHEIRLLCSPDKELELQKKLK